MGAQRAIVILSDHLQSNVETLALSGERLIIAPVERVNRSLYRMRSPQRLFGPEQSSHPRRWNRNPGSCCGAWARAVPRWRLSHGGDSPK
jgi:hypothetical protein